MSDEGYYTGDGTVEVDVRDLMIQVAYQFVIVVCRVCTSAGLKKDVTTRDAGVSPVAASLANTSVGSRLDSVRVASASHPDLRQQSVTPPRHGESAVSRLASKPAGTDPPLGSDSATELRLASENANSQRIIEWQMRNQMAKDAANVRQLQRRFDSGSTPALAVGPEQTPNFYSARPQSQLIEPGYVMPGSTKTASLLPQSASMPMATDNVGGNRGQTVAGFGQHLSAVETPYDQRYKPQQFQPRVYDQQYAAFVRPQFNQMASVRPPVSEVVRYPLPGMVPQDVPQTSPRVRSPMPEVHQQPPLIGKGMQYPPPVDATSSAVVVGSEQRPNYHPARPQSQMIEPGYAMSGPAKTTSARPQSTSIPAVVDKPVGNRGQVAASFGQQPSAVEMSYHSPSAYSDDQSRYKPQQFQPYMYDQQFAASVQPQFSQISNVRPQTSDMARYPLPGMVPQDVLHPGPNVHSDVRQQAPTVGENAQYRPSGGPSGGGVMAPAGVRYGAADVGGRMPVVSGTDGRPVHPPGVRYGPPHAYERMSAPSQYEVTDVQNRAVLAGVPFSSDSRPYAANEGPYWQPHVDRPGPADIRYRVQDAVGVAPSVRPIVSDAVTERKFAQGGVMPDVGVAEMQPLPPGVQYDTSSSHDSRLVGVVPSYNAPGDQFAMKFGQRGSTYVSPNTAVNYKAPDAAHEIHNTSVSIPAVPANLHHEAASSPTNTGDSWPLPPPSDSEFSFPPSISMQPPSSSRLSAVQFQNAGGGSKPLPAEVRPSVQNIVISVPSLPQGKPINDVRPKKQPPPIAAKPKFPISTGAAVKPMEVTKDGGKQLKPEKIQQKILEIRQLELRPYLTANEQTRLQNLRVEVEFDRRLAEMNEKQHDDNDMEPRKMLPSAVRFHLSHFVWLFTKLFQK